MSQKCTFFTKVGVPVRATADITFTQYVDTNDYPAQNPTSGGGPIERIRTITAGDRLDLIAAEVYGDATKWRHIAQRNNLRDPLALRPGMLLRIPKANTIS
jgi:nucleoid-associated protein YgaU